MSFIVQSSVKRSLRGFSLVEVVIAIGVVSFAIVAILGVFPVGLNTGRSAQNETRATQIAQDILASLVSQAPSTYPNCTIRQPATSTASDFTYNVALNAAATYDFAADNDGHLVVPVAGSNYPFQVTLLIAPDPPGFDVGFATSVTVRIAWQPFAQNVRNFVCIVSKY